MSEYELPLSETVRLMADVIREGKGRVQVTFEPSFLYEVANVLEHYEVLEHSEEIERTFNNEQ